MKNSEAQSLEHVCKYTSVLQSQQEVWYVWVILAVGATTMSSKLEWLLAFHWKLFSNALNEGVYDEILKSASEEATFPSILYIPTMWIGRNAKGPVGHHWIWRYHPWPNISWSHWQWLWYLITYLKGFKTTADWFDNPLSKLAKN